MTSFTPLPVEPTFFTWRDYQVALYSAGVGTPVLLIHSINAAASAFEMRGPFLGLQDTFRVHALDLPGYGRSDRPARCYRPDDYIDVILQVLQQFDEPAVVIASSLSATYAVNAALRYPEQVRSMVLVCPTGISLLVQPPGLVEWAIYRMLYGPVGDAVFDGLTSRRATRYFLKQEAYANWSMITPDVVDSFYQASHQPGAKYAPICFVTNLLNCSIADTFSSLTQPILIVWGRDAQTTPLAQADEFLARNPNAVLKVIDGCSMLAQDERPDEFNALVCDFLQTSTLPSPV